MLCHCVGLGCPLPCPVAVQVHWHPKAADMPPVHLPLALQENVSCLNTSLVILMLARRKERLPLYLRLLQRMEHSKKYPGFLLNNFHNLLRFWQQHYLHKDKDSTCLENVSSPVLSDTGRRVACGPSSPCTSHPLSLFLYSELLHQLLILEGDSVHPVEPRPPITLCPGQLHRRALHGHRQRLH